MRLPHIAIGAVCAALVAALASLVGLIQGKEQKTSEFRQAWINALRQGSAELVASCPSHKHEPR